MAGKAHFFYNLTMKDDCLFCSIANQQREKLIWENDAVAAFNDINPKATVHVLVVPKVHVENLDELTQPVLAGQLLMAIREVAAELGLKGGYQLKLHNGRAAGQEIDHLHFHLMADQPSR